MLEGIPVNDREDAVEYIRQHAIETARKNNLTLPLEYVPKENTK